MFEGFGKRIDRTSRPFAVANPAPQYQLLVPCSGPQYQVYQPLLRGSKQYYAAVPALEYQTNASYQDKTR
eukprot:1916548-Rhodomonas_salina.1